MSIKSTARPDPGKTALAAAIVALLILPANAEITEKNWRGHPAIVEVRKISNDIEEGIRKKIIKKDRDLFKNRPSGLVRKMVFFSDGRGNIRKCTIEDGTEDSAYTASHYYDKNRKLRFVFVRAGAVNGASVEYRIYFDSGPNRIRDSREYKTKQRYTFPDKWPDELILYDPLSALAED